MSLQDIEVSNSGSTTTGFKREINEGAMGLVLDTIQITQYTKPEESTVRELTANAVDSQREKEIAISILTGRTKPEDHFISRDGDKYKDSNWDASYYDINHLDQHNNKVELEYVQNQGTGYCDTFSVKDYGIGIGAQRLQGYFQLGYSTKRNSKDSLGAFGFGNKVALSTRCDYYTMETIHNGQKFKFNCYSYKIDSLIGKFNTKTGELNDSITFDTDGKETKIYFETTEEKNYTKISVPTKRHHRNKYESAVENQLLYFNNVKFSITDEYDSKYDRSFKANTLYESERIVVSSNSQFSRPHIIITKGEGDNSTGVCYGFIDFTEMEMEQLWGNIGVKCPIRSVIKNDLTGEEIIVQEGVEVTPSRESVVWSDHTRNFIINRFKEVSDEALEIVKEQLDEEDLLKWIEKVKDVKSKMDSGDNQILRELSRVVDRNSLKPVYQDTKIKFEAPDTFFYGFKVRRVELKYDSVKKKTVAKRTAIEKWSDFDTSRVYYQDIPTSYLKDAYLYKKEDQAFILIEPLDKQDIKDKVGSGISKAADSLIQGYLDDTDVLDKAIKTSSLVKIYADVVIPENFEEDLEEEEMETQREQQSAADRRKQLGMIPIHIMERNESYERSYSGNQKPYTFKQDDVSLADILDRESLVVYGGLSDSTELMMLGDMLSNQFRFDNPGYQNYYRSKQFNNDEILIVRLNKANGKHFKNKTNWKHVRDIFQSVTCPTTPTVSTVEHSEDVKGEDESVAV